MQSLNSAEWNKVCVCVCGGERNAQKQGFG